MSDQPVPVTGKDLMNPDIYKAFIEDRKANHQPVPPGNMIRHAGHHWLRENRQLSGSGDMGSMMVAQWSPNELRWYHSNDLATCRPPLYCDGLMGHWEWVAEVPVPV